MTNLVGIVSTKPNGPQQQAQTATAVPSQADAIEAKSDFAAQIAAAAELRAFKQPVAPRIIVDPLAGAITQFLNTSGQVETQIPSAAVVAYLRAGLTSSGFPKPQEDAETSGKPKAGAILA